MTPGQLRRCCASESLGFETTAELPPLSEVLGQPRAVSAFEFGVSIAAHEFNLFALGQPGSGKTSLIRDYLERRAQTQAAPPDLCYVYNFADARRPVPLQLPSGRPLPTEKRTSYLVSTTIVHNYREPSYPDDWGRNSGTIWRLSSKSCRRPFPRPSRPTNTTVIGKP